MIILCKNKEEIISNIRANRFLKGVDSLSNVPFPGYMAVATNSFEYGIFEKLKNYESLLVEYGNHDGIKENKVAPSFIADLEDSFRAVDSHRHQTEYRRKYSYENIKEFELWKEAYIEWLKVKEERKAKPIII